MVGGMYRIALLGCLASAAGCAGDSSCGTLTLELGEDVASYPTDVAIGCDVPNAGVWDKLHNVAAIVLTASDLPSDVYVVANMPLDAVTTGATLVVPTGIAGEAYTGDEKNHANLTAGTIVIQQDVGTDAKGPAHVFQVQWDLTWLGTGTYRSQSESYVWFTVPPGGQL